MTNAPDSSFRIRGRNTLDLRLAGSGGSTVREYLAQLAHDAMQGSRALAGPIRAVLIEHGMAGKDDTARADQLITEAIEVLAAEPFRPAGSKTGTARQLARLQRRGSPGRNR